MDDHGNLSAVVVVNDEVHDISLNFTHHPMRGGGDRLQILKNEAESMKCKLVDNLVKNINDQNQAGTLFEYASVFVLRRKIDLEERCALLVNLAEMYCKDYTHSVMAGEDDAFWVEYNISVKYPSKISGTVDEILSEFKNLHPMCNRKWGEYSKDLKEGNFRFRKHILSFYPISHRNLCKLVQIVFSVAGNTGPLERPYSRSAKLCYKDCNKLSTSHMSTQYILIVLKDFAFNYTSARELMESSLVINI